MIVSFDSSLAAISDCKESDTVTLTRAEYEALIERIEDAEDNAFLDAIEARERVIGMEKADRISTPSPRLRGEGRGEGASFFGEGLPRCRERKAR
jgi:hypothetical protein